MFLASKSLQTAEKHINNNFFKYAYQFHKHLKFTLPLASQCKITTPKIGVTFIGKRTGMKVIKVQHVNQHNSAPLISESIGSIIQPTDK